MDIAVKVIQKKGQAALVEWLDGDGTHRVTIPAKAIESGNRVAMSELGYGIPYGEPWEELVMLAVTPAVIAEQLRRAGIWTYEDLLSRPNQALGAIQAAYGFDLTALLRAAKQSR
jgi:hypothetical protein